MMGEAENQDSLGSVLPWNTEPGRRRAPVICPMSGGMESEREKVARRRDGRGEQSCGRVRTIGGQRAVQWPKPSSLSQSDGQDSPQPITVLLLYHMWTDWSRHAIVSNSC